MANPVWPPALPQAPLRRGFAEQFASVVVRTDMDTGPAKMRRRTTNGPENYDGTTFRLTAAQVDTFKTFFYTTLSYGALAFDWVHPRTGATKTWRFKTAPKVVPEDDKPTWLATCDLEMIG